MRLHRSGLQRLAVQCRRIGNQYSNCLRQGWRLHHLHPRHSCLSSGTHLSVHVQSPWLCFGLRRQRYLVQDQGLRYASKKLRVEDEMINKIPLGPSFNGGSSSWPMTSKCNSQEVTRLLIDLTLFSSHLYFQPPRLHP